MISLINVFYNKENLKYFKITIILVFYNIFLMNFQHQIFKIYLVKLISIPLDV